MPDISDAVKVIPANVIPLKAGSAADLSLKNTGKEVVTFKLKTTRPLSTKPSKAWGVIPPGGDAKVQIRFVPTAQEKPFGDADHLTVLVGIMPNKDMKVEDYWKSTAAVGAHRFVVKMSEGGKAAPPAAPEKKKAEKEESVASEESEASGTESEGTTESGTESGTTESGASKA